MRLRSYRDLIAWQKAVDLVVLVYKLTEKWPREELYGLTRQARCAVVSVAANIAEGYGRKTPKEFTHFLNVSYGSLMELETEIEVSQRLGFSPPDQIELVMLAAA